MTAGAHRYLLPALYSNASQSCVFSDPELPTRLKLASKAVRKGKKQTLTITTGPHAHLVMNIEPEGTILQAQASAQGKYVYRWKPKSAVTQIIVTAAAADGLSALARVSFRVRKHT